ncbi:hypothetical protein BH11MYX4_BH11MYX4_27310 [soil metagenome]
MLRRMPIGREASSGRVTRQVLPWAYAAAALVSGGVVACATLPVAPLDGPETMDAMAEAAATDSSLAPPDGAAVVDASPQDAGHDAADADAAMGSD